jgi:hypothetical protein
VKTRILVLPLLLALGLAKPAAQNQAQEGPAQIPRRILVGDRGRLILNPGLGFEEVTPFIIDEPWQFPQTQDLKIHRLEFQRLRDSEQLLIDFTAFAPGIIRLPAFDLPQMPGLDLEMYSLSIASILEGETGLQDGSPRRSSEVLVLSGPALPLAVPGTAFLIYGTASLIVLTLLIGLGLGIWGRPYLTDLLENYRRRRLVRYMGRTGRRLREGIAPGACGEVLRELSVEFRTFLGHFFDRNEQGAGVRDCRAMTAAEFLSVPPLFPEPVSGFSGSPEPPGPPPAWAELVSPPALGNYFRLLDRLRYSGEPAGPRELAAAIDRLDLILEAMDSGFRSRGILSRIIRSIRRRTGEP